MDPKAPDARALVRPSDELVMGSALAETITPAGPVSRRDRISSIDVLRGFALLGILAMNISSYALHEGFDFHPTSIGNIGKLNTVLWAVRFVLFEGKMRAIFSMLFGAGVILLTSRLEKRGEGERAADIFLRRNLWLLVFGVVHGFFLWFGDILYTYALTALLFLYPCRKLTARTLILAGLAAFAVMQIYGLTRYENRKHLIERAQTAMAAEAAGQKLSEDQQADIKSLQRIQKVAHPDPAELEKENAEMRGSYAGVFKRYAAETMDVQSTSYYRFGFCDALGMMLIGMGLLRLGFLSAQLPYRVYVWTAALAYAIGLPLGALSTWQAWRHSFESLSLFRWLLLPYDWQRLAVSLGHAAVVLIIVKAGALQWITRPLAAVGQTALSNYLGTSVICTLIFNGYGLGLFGKLQFYQLFYIVAGIWLFNLISSPLWLRYFRFGPLEWLWRSLTYWQLQPVRRSDTAPTVRIATAEAD